MPGGIAHGGGRFENIANLAVFAAHFKFEVRYRAMFLKQAPQTVPLRTIYKKLRGDVQGQQLFAGVISGHPQHGVVEIQKPAVRRGDEDAFLNAGDQYAVFILGAFAFGNVFQDVHHSQLFTAGIGKCGIRRQKISRQPGIDVVPFPGDAFAVRTIHVGYALAGETIGNLAADDAREIRAPATDSAAD